MKKINKIKKKGKEKFATSLNNVKLKIKNWKCNTCVCSYVNV